MAPPRVKSDGIKQSSSPEASRQTSGRAQRRVPSAKTSQDDLADGSDYVQLEADAEAVQDVSHETTAPDPLDVNLDADADVDDDDEDPVVSEYSVYISPEISWNAPAPITIADDDEDAAPPPPPPRNELLLLQFPTRTRMAPYNSEDTPVALRVKPRNGFIELDVPLHQGPNHDARKAKRWGEAMRATGTGAGRGSFGMANGFMSNPAPQRRGENDMEVDGESELQCQTLGGMLSTPTQGSPRHMLGTFRGGELHLTPVTGMAELRPQGHHLDAMHHQMKGATRGPDSGPTRGAGGARLLATAHKQPPPGGGGGVESTGTAHVKELLLAVAEEEWSELEFYEEEHQNSYDAFKKYTFLSSLEREQLMAEWDSEQYLDKIGGGSDRARRGTAALRRDRKRRGRAGGKGKGTDGPNDVEAVEVSSGTEEEDADERLAE